METDHWVTLLMHAAVAMVFSALAETSEGPGTLDEVLDDDLVAGDAMWLEDIAAARPTVSQWSQTTWFSAQVERYLRPRCAMWSVVGYPVYA